jgi:Asp-tRNA(Asn)/Glu-tRNA(Gln) amidotransferase A subunit family amidase
MSAVFPTVADYAEAYRHKSTTPTAVAERALAAIVAFDQQDPPMRFFISVHPEDVRAQAADSTRRLAAGQPRSVLEGVPVAVKDEFDVIGHRTTCGTSFLGPAPATKDALVVARLRAAGAVILGKTNMFELGVNPSGLNLTHGTARNPYDPLRDTGGSSSGSGAVVASGLCPLTLGNDGGGSIRIPAALCGVPGLKATYDRVPTDGVAVLCWSLEHSGPLGATVEDVRLATEILCDEKLPLPSLPSPLRVGICAAWWQDADPEVTSQVRAAVERLGATVVDIDLPHIGYATPVGSCTFLAEGAACLETHLVANAPFSPSVRLAFEAARGVSAPAFVKAQRVRAILAREFETALTRCDVLITPTTAITGPPYQADALQHGEIDEGKVNALVHFTFPLNLTGLPAMSVPCAYDTDGMPIGMQIIGRFGDDALTLAVAAAVEKTSPRRRPRVFVDLLG